MYEELFRFAVEHPVDRLKPLKPLISLGKSAAD
jgi:hypothetical protein